MNNSTCSRFNAILIFSFISFGLIIGNHFKIPFTLTSCKLGYFEQRVDTGTGSIELPNFDKSS